MALSEEELLAMAELEAEMTTFRPKAERLDTYFEGTWRLEQLGLAVPPDLQKFVTLANWPRVTAVELERRCDVEAFRMPDEDGVDTDTWAMWTANEMPEMSQLGHLDSLALGRAYACVGTKEDTEPQPGIPLITVESCLDLIHRTDTRTRQVKDALRFVSETQRTLYFPNETVWLEGDGKEWRDVDRDAHNLGVVPVVPLVSNGRLRNSAGTSEMTDVIPITDAAARALTNAQVATEVLATPQRYVLGAAPKDFVDKDGQPLTAWETYFGAVWALQNGNAKVGQFSAADLSNFEKIVNHYAALASGLSGLPTRYYGLYTTNPPSEGSIVADEVRLIMNAYRKHRAFGGAWRRTLRLAHMIANDDDVKTADPRFAAMETVWRNPETPTRAQTADAVTKLVTAKILPVEAAWEELGYSPARIARLKALREADLAADPLAAAANAFAGGAGNVDPQGDGEPVDPGPPADPSRADDAEV